MTRYYTVIPSVRLPRSAPDTFTYAHESDQALDKNTIVAIPFRNIRTSGIVTGSSHKPAFAVKNIRSVLGRAPDRFISFVQELSYLTFENNASLFRLCTLHIKHIEKNLPQTTHRNKGSSKISVKQYHSFDERLVWLKTKITKILSQNRSILVIIPNLFEAIHIAKTIAEVVPEIIILTGSSMSKQMLGSPKSERGMAQCIISTRIGSLLPIRFDELICDDEPNELHVHSEPAPSYDVRTVLTLRSSLLGESLTYSGYSLTLSTQTLIKKKTVFRYQHAPREALQWVSKVHHHPIPKTPITELALDLLSQSPHHINVITRSAGFSYMVTCGTCGYQPLCPSCDRPFLVENDYLLQCARCGTKATVPPFCPTCSGASFRYTGFGANRISDFFSKKTEFSKNTVSTFTLNQFEERLVSQQSPTILIADFDTLITPGFTGQELLYHRLAKLIAQTQPRRLIIQYTSERLKNDFEHLESFFTTERELRKTLALPPSGCLVFVRYYSPTTKQLSLERARVNICQAFLIDEGQLQSTSQTKRKRPYFTFLFRVDRTRLTEVKWKKLHVGFHCLQLR